MERDKSVLVYVTVDPEEWRHERGVFPFSVCLEP